MPNVCPLPNKYVKYATPIIVIIILPTTSPLKDQQKENVQFMIDSIAYFGKINHIWINCLERIWENMKKKLRNKLQKELGITVKEFDKIWVKVEAWKNRLRI
jgi:hypothetical protein